MIREDIKRFLKLTLFPIALEVRKAYLNQSIFIERQITWSKVFWAYTLGGHSATNRRYFSMEDCR